MRTGSPEAPGDEAAMGLPQVVIVGRPNVGKSSLLNWLAGRRIAVVDPTAGVTRDRVSHLVEIQGRFVELVDTGGIGIEDPDKLTAHIERQIDIAIDSAAVILFVVDTRAGVTALDREVDRRLRRVNVPVLCVANKTDHEKLDAQVGEFQVFGRQVVAVSAEQRRGKEELLEAIAELLPPVSTTEAPPEAEMKLAIVGRRNVGKSTFINTLVQEERLIVSEVPGTTRDSVDVRFELNGKPLIAIDTPGFRRAKSIATDIDFYSTARAERSIRRADVVLLFFDCKEPISKVDKQLCKYIAEQYKPCMFVVNKWDLLAGQVPESRWIDYLRDTFRSMWYVPVAVISGKTGKNVKRMLTRAQALFRQAQSRVSTSRLNKVLQEAIQRNPPPSTRSLSPRIYYATQVAVGPPTVVVFCNNPAAISQTYRQFLLNAFRQNLPFGEVPIKLYLRSRAKTQQHDQVEAR